MRIVVIGPLGQDSFADNVQDSLLRLGHEVVALGATRPSPRIPKVAGIVEVVSDHLDGIDEYRQRKLARATIEARADLLITTDRRLHRTVVEAAKSVGTKTALWFPDHVGNMGRHEMFLAGYDRIYMKNPVAVRRLRQIQGLPVTYLPEAANPSWHQSSLEYGTEHAVVMAGNVHPTRALLLARLLEADIPVKIYGAPVAGWVRSKRLQEAHTGAYLQGKRKADCFRSARAVLNNLHPAEYAGINCRVFEATCAGAVVLTEPREGLDTLFDVGREVDTFDSFDELLAKLRVYLASSEPGRVMGDAAAARTLRDHTYEMRLEFIFSDLFS